MALNSEENLSDIGAIGEANFLSLSQKIPNLRNVNKLHILDKGGWDYFIEFALEKECGAPWDLAPTPVRSFIQVKSSNVRKGKEAIGLQNMAMLVKRSDPVFFCFMEYLDSHKFISRF